jgi:pyrroloquinoline quinone (PQQ) biosynthesis protein C
MVKFLLQVEECKRECQFFKEHRKRFQTKHLNECLRLAQERKNEEAMEKIAAIIQQEKQRSFWHQLNYVTGMKRTRSATSIQIPATSDW